MADESDEISQGTGEGETTGGFVGRVKARVKLFFRHVCSVSPDRLSAIVLFIIVFAFSLGFTITEYLKASQPERFTKWFVPLWINILEGAAILVLGLMLRFADSTDTQPAQRSADPPQTWHGFIRRNIMLFGIVPFFVAVFIFDVFRFSFNVRCADAWTACTSHVVRLEHMTELFYPLVRAVYLFVQLIVCVKFNAADFRQNMWLLVALAFVEAVNLTSWLDALVNESIVFSSGRNSTYELLLCFNATDVGNVSDHFAQCYSHETGEYRLLESTSPYLYPFIMEYLMLVMECVADWFFSDARTAAPAQPVSDDQQPQPGTSSASDSVPDAVEHAEETDPLLGRRPTSRAKCFNACIKCFNCCPYPCLFVFVVLVILLNVLFVILGVYHLTIGEDGYRDLFMEYRIFYWLTLSLAAAVAYFVSRQFPSGPKNPSGFEYFITISSIGPILQCILSMVANMETEDHVVPTGLFLSEEISNMVQIGAQLLLYNRAKIVRIPTAEDDANNAERHKLCRSILKVVILCFVVCNFALWFEDSFIETRNSMTSWQKYYFEKWPLVYNMFNPLSLVFRFSSALLFLNILFDKRLTTQ